MKHTTRSRLVAGTTALALVAGPMPALADRDRIRCESRNFSYNYCRIDTDDRVELVRQYSSADCRKGRTWDYDRRGIWVDRGCAAEFRVGRHGGSDGDKKVAIGAALVGLAAIAAISANKSKEESAGEVASWAVGSFSGYDEQERTQVELTILPGGSVSGRAGRTEFNGGLQGNRLQAGKQLFRIDRQGNGFVATDERNAGHRVVFQRTGSGY